MTRCLRLLALALLMPACSRPMIDWGHPHADHEYGNLAAALAAVELAGPHLILAQWRPGTQTLEFHFDQPITMPPPLSLLAVDAAGNRSNIALGGGYTTGTLVTRYATSKPPCAIAVAGQDSACLVSYGCSWTLGVPGGSPCDPAPPAPVMAAAVNLVDVAAWSVMLNGGAAQSPTYAWYADAFGTRLQVGGGLIGSFAPIDTVWGWPTNSAIWEPDGPGRWRSTRVALWLDGDSLRFTQIGEVWTVERAP